MDKAEIINHVIEIEGGYVDDPSDSGGATNFGITESVARDVGYQGAMRDLPVEMAYSIYAAKYWDSVRADELLTMHEGIAAKTVDIAINMGASRAGKFLQRTLNALNNRGKIYADIRVDGAIGSGTLSALVQYLEQRNGDIIVNALKCLQGAFYIELTERREKDEKFLYGWLKNRI